MTNEAWEEEQMSNLGCESVSDLIVEVKRLREELNEYEKYSICHPDGTHCCDECLERNGFEVKK
tara:strand:- start:4233 stop:4424 length:192 start_codon:yes stop_codon:yes gene_type:complete